ncbi:hypothetical protein Tco_0438238 [Tanacetum coccineum]
MVNSCKNPTVFHQLTSFTHFREFRESQLRPGCPMACTKAGEEQASLEVANLKARSSATEARLAAACEQTLSAQKEAGEWKHKYDVAVKEAKSALEKADAIQDRTSKQIQNHEYALRAKFECTLADMESEIKDKARKIEQAEQRVTTLNMELMTEIYQPFSNKLLRRNAFSVDGHTWRFINIWKELYEDENVVELLKTQFPSGLTLLEDELIADFFTNLSKNGDHLSSSIVLISSTLSDNKAEKGFSDTHVGTNMKLNTDLLNAPMW